MKGGFLPLCLGVRWGLNGRDQQPRPWACWGWGEGPPPRVGNRRAQRAYRRSRGPAGEGDQQLHLGDGTAHQWGRAAVPRGPPGLEAGGQPLRTSRPAGGCPLPRACQVSRGRATIMPGGPPPFPGARQGSRGGVSCLCARGPATGCWWQFAAVTGDPPEGPGWWGLPWCTPACPGWPAGGSAMVRCRPLGTGRLGRGLLRCSGTHRELPARGVLYNPQWPSWGCHPGGNTQVPSSLS